MTDWNSSDMMCSGTTSVLYAASHVWLPDCVKHFPQYEHFKRSFSSMDSLVLFQVTGTRKGLSTLQADMRMFLVFFKTLFPKITSKAHFKEHSCAFLVCGYRSIQSQRTGAFLDFLSMWNSSHTSGMRKAFLQRGFSFEYWVLLYAWNTDQTWTAFHQCGFSCASI